VAPVVVGVPGGFNAGLALLGVLLLLVVAYAFPVLAAVHSPISGLIFGFALWEAWKMNKKVQLAFNGPFRLGGESAHGQAIEGPVDES
jgi:hypothetical protein